MQNNPEPLPPEIRAAFDNYPRPVGGAQFDAKFWRELDARRHRYRGILGLLRRLIEVEIEGIAVWRLGAALFSVPMVCAIGVALLNWSVSPLAPPPNAAQIAATPLNSTRLAREWLDEGDYPYRAPKAQKPKAKEEFSCVSFARGLA